MDQFLDRGLIVFCYLSVVKKARFFFWLVFGCCFWVGLNGHAQITLNGQVLNEQDQPMAAKVLLGRNTFTTQPDGSFVLSIGDWREIQTIRAEKEDYTFQKYELNRTNGIVTLHLQLSTRSIKGQLLNVRKRVVQGAKVTLADHPQVRPAYSNPKGVFTLHVPQSMAIADVKSRFLVDGNLIPSENVSVQEERVRIVIPENTQPFPVFQVRVHDLQKRRIGGVILSVGGRVYQADDDGVIQLAVDHHTNKETPIESSQWLIQERSYDPVAQVLLVYLTTKTTATETAKTELSPEQRERAMIENYKLTLDEITGTLEQENFALSDKRGLLIQQIEELTLQLAKAPKISDEQREELAQRLYRLEEVLEEVNAAYERNRQRTDSLMQMMRNLILQQKKEIEQANTEREVIKTELFNTFEEKIQAEEDYNRRLRLSAVIIASVLLLALGTYFFLLRIRRQKRELEQLHNALLENNRKITDNMRYAKDIQDTILPTTQALKAALHDHFVIFQPRELVSGDFYWLSHKDPRYVFVAVVDCTGHGVSGAFMSMIGYTALNEIVHQSGIRSPAQILDELHFRVKVALKQDDQVNDDGMDVCLCRLERLDEDYTELVFAGAKRSLYLYQQHKINTLRGSSRSVGGRQRRQEGFAEQVLRLRKGDRLYLTSDGLSDQNNHAHKKLGTRRLLDLIYEQGHKTMAEQQELLLQALREHQGQTQQRDDITVVGIEI